MKELKANRFISKLNFAISAALMINMTPSLSTAAFTNQQLISYISTSIDVIAKTNSDELINKVKTVSTTKSYSVFTA